MSLGTFQMVAGLFKLVLSATPLLLCFTHTDYRSRIDKLEREVAERQQLIRALRKEFQSVCPHDDVHRDTNMIFEWIVCPECEKEWHAPPRIDISTFPAKELDIKTDPRWIEYRKMKDRAK